MECAICFEERKCVMFFPCRHQAVCQRCMLQSWLLANTSAGYKCCLCRQKVTSVSRIDLPTDYDFMEHFPADLQSLLDDDTCTLLYLGIKRMLKCHPKIPADSIFNNTVKSYRQLSKGEKRPLHISVDQCEILLQAAEQQGILTYEFKNLFVALCVVPWKVDRKLGGCGVCYHGNFGDLPDSPAHAWALLKKNRLDVMCGNLK